MKPATIADLKSLYAIDPLQSDERRSTLEKFILEQKLWFESSEQGILGYIAFGPDFFNQAFIHLVVVAPAHQRKKIATALVRQAEDKLHGKKIFTSTSKSNKAAYALFTKLGYGDSGMIENLDDADLEIVLFRTR